VRTGCEFAGWETRGKQNGGEQALQPSSLKMPNYQAILLPMHDDPRVANVPHLSSTTPNKHREQLDSILSRELIKNPIPSVTATSPPKPGMADINVQSCHGWDKQGLGQLTIVSLAKVGRKAEEDEETATALFNLNASKLLTGPTLKDRLPVYGPALVLLQAGDEDSETSQEKVFYILERLTVKGSFGRRC
jgi:hypothetical protein